MRVFITGVCGQDGSYLAEMLTSVGHSVYGLVRGQDFFRRERLLGWAPKVELVEGDLLDQGSLTHALKIAQPDTIYHLGAVTAPGMAWGQPVLVAEVTGLGTLRLLEAARTACPKARIVVAGSLANHGPYGAAKTLSTSLAREYRAGYGMHISVALFSNHTSPRQGVEFLPRKVTRAVARIARGLDQSLHLGDVEAYRDWGSALDYICALPLMAQRAAPEDWVVATGRLHSVRELVAMAFEAAGLDYRDHLVTGTELRPWDPALISSDQPEICRTSEQLGWTATVSLPALIRKMVEADLAAYSH